MLHKTEPATEVEPLVPAGDNVRTLPTLAPSPGLLQEEEMHQVYNEIHVMLWPVYHKPLIYLAMEFMKELLHYCQLSALSNLSNKEPDMPGW